MRVEEIIDLARDALDEPVTSCGPGEVMEGLRGWETLARVALAKQLQYVAEADHQGLASEHGARNTKALLQQVLLISGAEADSRTKVARNVADRSDLSGASLPAQMPATAHALREGEITLHHASVIGDGIQKITGLVPVQKQEEAETFLVEQARGLVPRDVQTLAHRLVYLVDQDGSLREEERQHEDRELHYGVGRDGMTLLKGRLDRETGAKLRAALEPLAAPKPAQNGEHDPRTAGQRNADALDTVLDLALSTDGLPRTGGQRPHITVTVSLDSLQQRLPSEGSGTAGTIETTGQPLTAAQIRRISCDAEILPVVMGGDSQPLDVGRTQRTAPPHIRAALMIRDGGCAFPSCDHPPGTPEAHHRQHWADGGETALHNMVMLCAHHHRVVHNQGWGIEFSNRRPLFIPPPIIDPRQKPRPGNRPLHLDHPPLIFD